MRDTAAVVKAVSNGTGSPRLDSVMAVLGALGIAETVVRSADPFSSPAGRALMDEQIALTGEATGRRGTASPASSPS